MGDTYRASRKLNKTSLRAKREESARYRRVRQTLPFFFERLFPSRRELAS